MFLSGQRNPISVEYNLRSGFTTLDASGKAVKSWEAKSFTDAFSVPYNFVHEGCKFTIKKKTDEEGNEADSLELEIEGLLFT